MYIRIKYLINPLRLARAAWHVDKYSLMAGSCHDLPKKGLYHATRHQPAIREDLSMCCKINSGRECTLVN